MLAFMEFQDVVRRRRMVRNYTDEPVDPAVVERALANATRAPSAGFSQGWGFLVLDTAEDVRRFWEATADEEDEVDGWLGGMSKAPVVVLPCSSKQAYLDRYTEPDKGSTPAEEQQWPVPFWHMDAAMASLLILQTAVDEGLGACFFGVPTEVLDAVREAFAIPAAFKPVGAITLGHPAPGGAAGSPTRRGRKPQDQVVHHGRWGA
jgi:nitroreductase